MATDLNDIINSLEDVGFYDVALPFLLVFTLIFAVLQKIQIFGEKGKNFNAVFAAITAFLVVRNANVVATMNTFLPQVSLLVLLVAAILIILGLILGKKSIHFTKGLGGLSILIIIIAVVASFLFSSGAISGNIPAWLRTTRIDTTMLVAGVVGLIVIYVITGDSTGTPKTLGERLEQLMGGIGGNQ